MTTLATKAFTLVELLIVVIILAILAAVIVPQFSNASATARASMLADDIRILRTQIEVFKAQHIGVSPAYPDLDPAQTPTQAAFIQYMTMASTKTGAVAAPGTAGYPYGPYMREIPVNPVNTKDSINVITDGVTIPAAPTGNDGYVYEPVQGIFKADCLGDDPNGTAYFDY